MDVSLAVIQQAAQIPVTGVGPLPGVPSWLLVIVGAVAIALGLWIVAKILRILIWIGIIVVLVAGAILAARMIIGA